MNKTFPLSLRCRHTHGAVISGSFPKRPQWPGLGRVKPGISNSFHAFRVGRWALLESLLFPRLCLSKKVMEPGLKAAA